MRPQATPTNGDGLAYSAIHPYLDYIHLMVYDMYGAWYGHSMCPRELTRVCGRGVGDLYRFSLMFSE